MATPESAKKPKIAYAWVVFALCFIMIFCVLGFCSSSKSLYLAPITDDLGISRSLFSISDSCRYVTTAIINLFFGFLILKLKPRLMAAAGFLSLIAFALISAFAQSVAQFYIAGVFLGIGLAWTTTTLVGYVVERWFTKSKGTVMGVILAANGLGAALASQVVSPVINASADGWRKAYLLSAAVVAACGVLVVLFLRNSPEDVGQEPLGTDKTAKEKRGSKWEGMDFSEAKKHGYFYLAALCVFLTGLILQSATGVSSAHMKDCGIDPAFIATALSIHSIALAAAKMYTGFSFDHFGLRITLLVCYVFAGVSLVILAFVSNNTMAMLYSVFSSIALPLETIMVPLIALDLFGQKSYAKMMGIFLAFNTAGYALGAPLVNVMYDITGSYRSILLILAALSAVIAVIMLFAITQAHKVAADLAEKAEA